MQVDVEVNPTESMEKVVQAVENMFGPLSLHTVTFQDTTFLHAETTDLDALSKLYHLLRRESIRDAARKVFFAGLHGNTISIHLNKQVAFVDHISFSNETAKSPLGPIKVRITCSNPRDLIDWLAPRTTSAKRKKASRTTGKAARIPR